MVNQSSPVLRANSLNQSQQDNIKEKFQQLNQNDQQNTNNNNEPHNEDEKTLKIETPVLKQLYQLYKFLQSKVENQELKKQFLARKCERTPKYRGQIHNYGKWISLIPSALLIYSAQSSQSRKLAIIYSIGVFWMQYISSKMHCRPFQTAPTWIRKVDNISIFLYIGMNWYTIGAQLLQNDPNWPIMLKVFVSIMTCAITLRSLTLHSPRWLISGMALAMGWMSLIGLPTMIQKMTTYECVVFAGAGLSITFGTLCWALQFPKKSQNSKWTPHETFHLGTVFMMFFFYLVLFSLQQTHPAGI